MTIFSLNLTVDAAVSIKFDTCKMRHNEPLLLIYSSTFTLETVSKSSSVCLDRRQTEELF